MMRSMAIEVKNPRNQKPRCQEFPYSVLPVRIDSKQNGYRRAVTDSINFKNSVTFLVIR